MEELRVLQREGYQGVKELYKYGEVMFRSVLYTSTNLVKPEVRSDDSGLYTWCCHKLCEVQHQNEEISGVFMYEYDVQPMEVARHIVKIQSPEKLFHFIKLNSIRSPTVSLKLGHEKYLVPLANCYEID